MRVVVQIVSIVCVLLLMAGCGTEVDGVNDNQSPANQPGNDNQPIDEIPDLLEIGDDLIRAHCEVIFDCCTSDQVLQELGLNVSDVDECVDQQQGIFRGLGTAQLEVSVIEGRTEVDEGYASSCKSQIENIDCSEFQGTTEERKNLPGCDMIVQGMVGTGGTCYGDWECQSGVCEGDEDSDDLTQGTCRELPELGEECLGRMCGPTGYCDSFDSVCMELRLNGTSCNEDKECVSGYCHSEEQDGSIVKECADRPPACQ